MRNISTRLGLTVLAALGLAMGAFVSAANAGWANTGPAVNKGNAQDWDMTWSGRVDDRVQIRIRGRSASSRVLSGRSVRQVNYNFRRSLPRQNVYVRVDKREGRGSVDVIQQPNRSNNYTAVIEIYDNRGSDDFYRFDLFWSGGGGDFPINPNPNFDTGAEMTWQGRVDERVRVTVRGRQATAYAVRGQFPRDIRYDFRDSLPRDNVRVSVRKRDGRGTVRVVSQPTRSNGYSAVIEIYDSRGGDDFYSFELDWDRGGGNYPPDNNNYGLAMTWSGSVDDVAWITIRGRQVYSQIRSGQRIINPRWNINKTLPRRNVTVRVDKREGRGSVRVVQQPRSNNNYSAIIEIRDSRGGRDNYSIDVDW